MFQGRPEGLSRLDETCFVLWLGDDWRSLDGPTDGYRMVAGEGG